MNKKLGLMIVVITLASVIAVVAIILTVTLISFSGYNDTIIMERANVGVGVLENNLKTEVEKLTLQQSVMTNQSSFLESLATGNTEEIKTGYNMYYGTEADLFMVAADESGNIIFKSDKYPFSTFDLTSIARGTEVHGIVKCDGEMVAMYGNKVTVGDRSFAVVMGFTMEAQDWLDTVKNGTDCDVTIFNANVRYSTTLGSNLLGTTMASNIEAKVITGKSKYLGQATLNNKPYYVAYTPMYDYQGNICGAYFAGSDATDSNSEFTLVTVMAVIIAVIGAAFIAVFIIIFSQKRVTVPLKHAETYAREMLNGQLSTTDVSYKFQPDEVGQFVEVLREAKEGMNAVVTDVSRILDAMAGGDFTIPTSVNYPGEFESIEKNIMKIEEDLGNTLSKMSMSSDEVMEGSNQMAEGSQSLADGTTKQASAIEEISATIAEVSAQISSTAQNAARAGDLSKQTEQKIGYQDEEIKNMVNAMSEISDTSKEIEKIIKTIDDIAFQTNILALNAAVEAARAGDAGKGFAVVADEVRNLASKSAEAANSTTSLINASIEAVDKGSKIAMATAEAMKEVKEISAETGSLIVEIAEASAEQNESIRQITTGIEQISQVIQMNSATAEETAASCEELSGQSKLLKDQVSRFKINQ